MNSATTILPLTLYIHIPWCVRKCPYCDFNSHERNGEISEQQYIDALLADLEQDLPLIWGRRINAIFIGGGTPSLFSPESINQLIAKLRACLNFHPHIEITLEANPGTAEMVKFSEYKSTGINRLSIGVQSFQDLFLQKLGRIHGGAEAIAAVEMAHTAGFDNINVDLMYGLPGQSITQMSADLDTAIALAPTHISFYQLTIEPNTLFHVKPPRSLPTNDAQWLMQQTGIALLQQHNYHQYEVSAYAQPGKQCEHNLNYWQFGDYIGIGAGAHAKLTNLDKHSVRRMSKTKQPKRYMATAGTTKAITTDHVLNSDDLRLEFMMNALRLTAGFPAALFSQTTGLDSTAIETALNNASARGLLFHDDNIIKPTAQGQRFLNDLVAMFLPD